MDNRLRKSANVTLCIDHQICISSNGTSAPSDVDYGAAIPHPDDDTFFASLRRAFKYAARYLEAERNDYAEIYFSDDRSTFVLWYTPQNRRLRIIELPAQGLNEREQIALVRRRLGAGEWIPGRLTIRNTAFALSQLTLLNRSPSNIL